MVLARRPDWGAYASSRWPRVHHKQHERTRWPSETCAGGSRLIVDTFGYQDQPAPILGRRLLLGRRVVVAQPSGRGGANLREGTNGCRRRAFLRQGSTTVQDLTSPIAPNCQFPHSIRRTAMCLEKVDILLPAFAFANPSRAAA